MSATANTPACFEAFIGQRVVGILLDTLPADRRDLSPGTKMLIFEDGRGLTIASNGSFWIDSAEDVERAVAATRRRLEATQRRLADVLALANARAAA